MSQAPSVALAAVHDTDLVGAAATPSSSADGVSLRGTTRGLEILISGTPSTAALGARLTELLAEAPAFFAGCTARVAIDGALPGGALACLEDIATRFQIQIAEIAPVVARARRRRVPAVLRPDDVPQVNLAEGTGPIADEAGEPRGRRAAVERTELPGGPVAPAEVVPAPGSAAGEVSAASPAAAANAAVATAPAGAAASAAVATGPAGAAASAAVATAQAGAAASVAVATAPAVPPAADAALADVATAMVAAAPHGPRLVIGPVRSGMIVDHTGHVIVIGDVNPGAEVRAEGSIIVLGRLRGVAHAAIGRDAGCIVALSLQPQQLRIGRMVARAGDADRPSDGAEIAYATGETIVVERFLGRLPSGLAASM
jgi:septum formation inhibitor MinC